MHAKRNSGKRIFFGGEGGEFNERGRLKKKVEFLIVVEACKAIFWQALEKRTFDSSGFSAKGTLFSASAAPHYRVQKCWNKQQEIIFRVKRLRSELPLQNTFCSFNEGTNESPDKGADDDRYDSEQ